MTTGLLPSNATPLERALDDVLGAGIDGLTHPIRDLWNPAAIPAEFLPWLAWAASVDEWDDDWPEATKRQAIADSFEIHRRKGTPGAIKRGLRSLGYGGADIVEGFPQVAHDGEVQRDGAQTYAGASRWAVFDVVVDLGEWRGFDEDQRQAAVRQINLWKNARSHLRRLSAIIRLSSTVDDDADQALDFLVGLNLFGSPGPRDGRYTRGTVGLLYRHDGIWERGDHVPRDGSYFGGQSEIFFGGERDPIELHPGLLLSGERTKRIQHNWRAHRGQGLRRDYVDAFEVRVDRVSWVLNSRARGLVFHDGAHQYASPIYRGAPGEPSAVVSWSAEKIGGDVFQRRIKRPAPGAFRTGAWRYGGSGAAPEYIDPPTEDDARTAPFQFVSSMRAPRRDGSRTYTDGSGAWRGRRTAPTTSHTLSVTTQFRRGMAGLSRVPILQHDGAVERNGTHRRTQILRYGPLTWFPDEAATA